MSTLTPRAAAVDWTDRAEAAGYLADLVPDLVCRIRDDDPDLNAVWIARRVPADHWPALALILAAHIPTDRSQTELIAWALPPDNPALWRDGHRKYVALRSKGVPIHAIDRDTAEAESRYQAASYAARTKTNDAPEPTGHSDLASLTPAHTA